MVGEEEEELSLLNPLLLDPDTGLAPLLRRRVSKRTSGEEELEEEELDLLDAPILDSDAALSPPCHC